MEAGGSSMVQLLDLVHRVRGVEPYSRAVVMLPFAEAFGMGPLQLSRFVFACEIFGDGATLSIADAERRFREWMRRSDGGAEGSGRLVREVKPGEEDQ